MMESFTIHERVNRRVKKHIRYEIGLCFMLIVAVTISVTVILIKEKNKKSDYKVINSPTGMIRGLETKNDYRFLGVPYAEPPKRFHLATPKKPWSGVLNAFSFGDSCVQFNLPPNETMSENCLYLNIYVGKNNLEFNSSLPVMIWIHGGSLNTGSGSRFFINPPQTFLDNVILVTINYRLNTFGFMYMGPNTPIKPNIGLQDQLIAIEWVENNIASFGGNPKLITLFGESAGSMSVSAHLISPKSSSHFHRAILQSGTILFPSEDTNLQLFRANEILLKTGCLNVSCLEQLDYKDILYAQDPTKNIQFRWWFGDDDFLPKSKEQLLSELNVTSHEVFVGVVNNEFSVFMPYLNDTLFDFRNNDFTELDSNLTTDILSLLIKREKIDNYRINYSNNIDMIQEIYSNFIITCPTVILGSYFPYAIGYILTQKPAINPLNNACQMSNWMGVCHGDDLIYLQGLPIDDTNYPVADRILSQIMINKWINFAVWGDLNTDRGGWPRLKHDRALLEFNYQSMYNRDYKQIEYCFEHFDSMKNDINGQFFNKFC